MQVVLAFETNFWGPAVQDAIDKVSCTPHHLQGYLAHEKQPPARTLH